MSIHKGLIIYRALRHSENYPINLKYKKSSNKASLSTDSEKSHGLNRINHRNSKKFVQHATLEINPKKVKNSLLTSSFQSVRCIKKCSFVFPSRPDMIENSQEIVLEITQRALKTFKRLKHVKFDNIEPLQTHFKAFKNLFSQKHLQSLEIASLKYAENGEDLQPFLRFLKKASTAKYWPHLRSLQVNPFFPKSFDENQRLKGLLKFFAELKTYETIFKVFSYQISLPCDSDLAQKNLEKIYQLCPSITHISASFSKLFPKGATSLKSLRLDYSDEPQENLDLRAVNDLSAFEKIDLSINTEEIEERVAAVDLDFYVKIFRQVEEMTNLKSLTIDFVGNLIQTSDLEPHVLTLLSKLKELTYLNLMFNDALSYKNWTTRPWLVDVFEEISEMKQLKTLCMHFTRFKYEEDDLIKSFGKSIRKLTQLTTLSLDLEYTAFVKNEEVLSLADSLKNLTHLESLSIKISDSKEKLKDETLRIMLENIMQCLPKLSYLRLVFDHLYMTKESFQLIYEAIHKMKCLSEIDIRIIGDFKMGGQEIQKCFESEIQQRMTGMIRCKSF